MVYVDNMKAAYRGMTMCHMMADFPEELLEMAARVGVAARWLQKAGTYAEHFDICLSKRKLAVRHGAVEVTQKELVKRMLLKRGQVQTL